MIKHVFNYLSVSIFSVLLGLISIPVLTRLLNPNEYGTYHTFLALVAIANILLTLNFHTAIGRYWYEEKGDKAGFITLSFFGSFLLLSIFSGILYSMPSLQKIIGLESSWIKYLILLVMSNVFFTVYNQVLVPQRKSKRLAVFSIVKIYSSFALGITFIYVLPVQRMESLILGQVMIGLFLAVFVIKELKQYITMHFSKIQFFYIIQYSAPLFFYSISAIFMAQIDRLMLTDMLSSVYTGFYSLAFIIANLFSMILSAVMKAWTPNYFEDMKNKQYAEVKIGINKLSDIAFFIAVFIILFGTYVGYILVDQKYDKALQYIPLMTLGMYLSFIYQLYGRAIGYAKKTVWIAMIFITAAIVNVFLNYVLIPEYGIMGAISATLVANILLVIGGYTVNKFILHYNEYIIYYALKIFVALSLLILIKFFLEYRTGIMIHFVELSLFFSVGLYLIKKYRQEVTRYKNKIIAFQMKKDLEH